MVCFEQLAAMNMIYNRYSFEYFIDSISRQGIKTFELWTGTPHVCTFLKSLRKCSQIRQVIDRSNMKIVCVTPEQVMYPYNIAAADSEQREMSIQYFVDNIRLTAEIGADKMLCCAGWGNYDGPREDAWKRSVDGLERLLVEAERNNIILAFEVLNPMESNLVYNFETTKIMMCEVNHPLFQLCVDTVPVQIGGNTLQEYFDEFGTRICHVHLTDGNPVGHVPCGIGTNPIQEYIDTLNSCNYGGYITLEIGDTSWANCPEEATRIGFQYVKRVLGIVN